MSRYKYDYDNCVFEVIEKIVEAQNKVADKESGRDCCSVSCERSIDQLLSPSGELGNNTIPFVLYSKGALKPFVGSGFRTEDDYFNCVESPVFRAKRFVDYDCVELELLLPVTGRKHDDRKGHDHHDNHDGRGGRSEHDHGRHHHDGGRGHGGHGHHDDGHHDRHHRHCKCLLCDFTSGKRIKNFRASGVCITVDLNCFCAITCLDPIRPLPAS